MSGAVHIRKRTTKSGTRYDVRWRFGGRGYPIHHAGTFPTQELARKRRDLVAGELANGRDPRVLLAELQKPKIQPKTLEAVYDDFIASRIDVTAKTLAGYRNAQARLGDLASKLPGEVTAADWQKWIADNADLSPGTLGVYMSNHRLVLDHADVEPNTARSPKVRLPAAEDDDEAEYEPPSSAEWDLIQEKVAKKSLLILRLMEADALRIDEALRLTYGDADFVEGRVRVSASRTKGRRGRRRARWVHVPPPLLDAIEQRVPLEDRNRDRRIFAELTDSMVRHDLARACRNAGIAHYHPHDLRHRRISLWIAHGIDVVTVKTWAGHSRASMSTDTYGHVIVPGKDLWRSFWLETYAGERRLASRTKEVGA